MDGFVEQLH